MVGRHDIGEQTVEENSVVNLFFFAAFYFL